MFCKSSCLPVAPFYTVLSAAFSSLEILFSWSLFIDILSTLSSLTEYNSASYLQHYNTGNSTYMKLNFLLFNTEFKCPCLTVISVPWLMVPLETSLPGKNSEKKNKKKIQSSFSSINQFWSMISPLCFLLLLLCVCVSIIWICAFLCLPTNSVLGQMFINFH